MQVRAGWAMVPGAAVVRRVSAVVDRGAGGPGAAAGEGPANNARLRLGRAPAGGLLRAMVGAARGVQVALVGWALGIGEHVVKVGVD